MEKIASMCPFPYSQRKPLTAEKALLRATMLCARGEHATGEIADKLRSWGVSDNDARDIIGQLTRERYLDDRRFARAYCRDKFRFNGWGRMKIRLMLRSKSIDDELIAEALDELNDDAYRDMARRVIATKLKSQRDRDGRQLRATLARHAASRGFEPDVFFPVIDELLNGTACEEED